ncbi:protein of unknown function DUF192 [Rippkaea orientalis PCC 8801]|uniref:DUF192 domain-containing protein n=1 Tax=Rippkaea orientalis (strain PCC 8801 / RF-1) TaxID=41431 RepID=B7K1C3_RIPO1|nr:DUF192 domain-containing protein [Rippkaea orientalis]ACK66318.1 protein of unknown function DUF192 [Rippkaea orientalis PCC 8801]
MIKRPLLLIIALSVLLLGCSNSNSIESSSNSVAKNPTAIAQIQGQKLPIEAQVKIGEQVIDLEVAKTPEQQRMGLMYRPSLEDNQGMVFPFDPPQPVRFWMKNVSIPLDMIFLFKGEVKAIESNVPPCTTARCPTYGPSIETEIDQVIELRGGRAEELGIKPGDRLTVEFFNSPSKPQSSLPKVFGSIQ